ncbi:MAG: hypothetical protein R3D25_22825 [Geminicoccaceae bacterium]
MATLAIALALASGSPPALAEVTVGGERAAASALRPGALEGRVSARCWQDGLQVLAIDDFAAAEVGQQLKELSLGLQGGGGKRSAVIVPLADSLCLLTISP